MFDVIINPHAGAKGYSAPKGYNSCQVQIVSVLAATLTATHLKLVYSFH